MNRERCFFSSSFFYFLFLPFMRHSQGCSGIGGSNPAEALQMCTELLWKPEYQFLSRPIIWTRASVRASVRAHRHTQTHTDTCRHTHRRVHTRDVRKEGIKYHLCVKWLSQKWLKSGPIPWTTLEVRRNSKLIWFRWQIQCNISKASRKKQPCLKTFYILHMTW